MIMRGSKRKQSTGYWNSQSEDLSHAEERGGEEEEAKCQKQQTQELANIQKSEAESKKKSSLLSQNSENRAERSS